CCEDDAELGSLRDSVANALLGVADHHDRDVDVVGYVGERRVALDPVDLRDPRVHRIDLRALALAPFDDLAEQRVARLALLLGRADQRDRPRMKEQVEVGRRHPAGLHCGSETPSSTSSKVTSTGMSSCSSSFETSNTL